MEPLNPETDHAIAAMLPAEDATQNAICFGKSVHDVWRCRHTEVKKFLAAAPTLGLKFVIFKKEDTNGPIRPWRFEKTRK